jgi:Ca2+-binding RTX toxin-like protein
MTLTVVLVAAVCGSASAATASLTCKRAGSGVFLYDRNLSGNGTWRSVLRGTAAAERATWVGGIRGGASLTFSARLAVRSVHGRCRATVPGRVAFREALFAGINTDLGGGDDILTLDFAHRTHPTFLEIALGAGDDTATLMGQSDARRSDPFRATISGGPGDDHLVAQSHTTSPDRQDGYQVHVSGGPGADVLTGGDGSEQLDGGSGSDVVRAGGGPDDIVFDGGGNHPVAGADDDTVDAGPGDDVVQGGAGADTIALGDGNDLYFLPDGADGERTTLDCGLGQDRAVVPEGQRLASITGCEEVVTSLDATWPKTGPFDGTIPKTDRLGRIDSRIVARDDLGENSYIASPTGSYYLLLRNSGELSLYDAQLRRRWTSHTAGGDDNSLRHVVSLQLVGGKLALVNTRFDPLHAWRVSGATAIELRDDGSLVAMKGQRMVRRILGPDRSRRSKTQHPPS